MDNLQMGLCVRIFVVDESTTRTIAYAIFGISFAVMIYFIAKQAAQNRKSFVDDKAPKIAGADTLTGGAKNPQQFDEPDDDALDEMAKLLDEDDD
ncbi:MAG TPA: hypothetical protein D7I07_01655 [Candidatus Poseidoniales archaeon]|nr:MAG TPA: hypothetical protein D7I07_01655 [Candidatus Poseidoniales archaeon]